MSEQETIFEALCKVQAAVSGAKKDATNPHFKSQYATLQSVWEAVRVPLTDNGFSVHQAVQGANDDLRLVTRLQHSSGEFIEDGGVPLILQKKDMQGLGSAITYARRYGLMAAVGISPEDDDGEGAGKTEKEVTYINEGQRQDLEALIQETATDQAKLLQHFKLESLDKVPATYLPTIIAALEKKRG